MPVAVGWRPVGGWVCDGGGGWAGVCAGRLTTTVAGLTAGLWTTTVLWVRGGGGCVGVSGPVTGRAVVGGPPGTGSVFGGVAGVRWPCVPACGVVRRRVGPTVVGRGCDGGPGLAPERSSSP